MQVVQHATVANSRPSGLALRPLFRQSPILYRLLRLAYYVLGVYKVYLHSPGSFVFRGRAYRYFHHWYGMTFLIERTVEIPVVHERVLQANGGRVLELGNCLSHFFPSKHDVLDKYENAPGVINDDVASFAPSQLYDLIVSISTIEHVGWDEYPRDPAKAPRALHRLREFLVPGGEMLITWPLGHNTSLDRALFDGHLAFDSVSFLKRVTQITNRWVEVGVEDAGDARYDAPFRSGNVIVFATWKKPAA